MTGKKMILGYGLYLVLACVVCAWILFPGRRLAAGLSTWLTRQVDGVQISVADAGPVLPLKLEMTSIEVETTGPDKSGTRFFIDRLGVAPVWTSLWKEDRALDLTAVLYDGKARARIDAPFAPGMRPTDLRDRVSVTGSFEGIRIEQVQYAHPNAHITVSCRAAGRGNFTRLPESKDQGNGTFHLAECAVDIDNAMLSAMGIPGVTFAAVVAEWTLSGQTVNVKDVKATGPEMRLTLKGQITLSSDWQKSRLKLSGSLVPDTAFLAGFSGQSPLFMMIRRAGGRGVSFKIRGTLKQPEVTL